MLVEALRFTTALDVATASGASVRTRPGRRRTAAAGTMCEVAAGTGPRGLSLSLGRWRLLGPCDGIVLPSPTARTAHAYHAVIRSQLLKALAEKAGPQRSQTRER